MAKDDLATRIAEMRKELEALERMARERNLGEEPLETDAEKRIRLGLATGGSPFGKAAHGGFYDPTQRTKGGQS